MGRSKLRVFKINLFNGTQAYSAGSDIEGNVFIELSKAMVPVKSIKIQLSGIVHVHWSEQNGEYKNMYKNSEGICNLTWTIWKNESSSQQQAAASTSVGLSAGRHEFPFKVQIPADLALLTSFESPHGKIQYSLIAGIAKSQENKLEHTIAQRITVRDIVNIYAPRLMEPLSRFEQKMVRTTWHSHGLASLSVTINKGGYYPGEFIATNVQVENQSTKQITAIQVLLVQKITYNGRLQVLCFHRQKNHPVHRIIQGIEGSGIPAGQTGNWNNGILPVPVTPPTTDRQHIINISYAVDVILNFHKADNLNVQIPVVIGSTPV